MLDAFHSYLLKQYAERRRVVLLIDEAQNLPAATLEELRMLSNLETEKEHLIQMILLGQPNLRNKLRRKGLEQFVQRVTVHYHLRGLAPLETSGYIRHRLHVAGGNNPELFTPEAVRLVHEASHGIPRMINILCDGALVYGYADGLARIDEATVAQVIGDRGGLDPASDAQPEADAFADSDVLERMVRVERKLELLGDRIDQHLTAQENREGGLEKRLGLEVASTLSGWSAAHLESRLDRIERLLRQRPAGSAPPLPDLRAHRASGPAPFPVADPGSKPVSSKGGAKASNPGLFTRVLNQIRS
jgi:general secretion pathway protein A